MNSDFRVPVDIANRALQHCGARRITTLADASNQASEVRSVYDKLRIAELRRNVWSFATKRTMIRPVDVDTMLITFPNFDLAKAYPKFYPVVDTTGRIYQAQQFVTAGSADIDDDTAGSIFTRYFGVDVAHPYDSTLSYVQGEIVYSPTTALSYMALSSDADYDPSAGAPAWDATITYRAGDTVTYLTLVYQSNADLNLNLTPGVSGWTLTSALTTQQSFRVGQKWLALTGSTLAALEFAYPLNSGPLSQPSTRNVYRLPVGWLRDAPQSPKAGGTSYLGAPWGLVYTDWEWEAPYFTTSMSSGIIYRFVHDASDVKTFDPMFCEGLGARIALEVVERLTQSDAKLSTITAIYAKFMGEARTVNGIETGPSEPPIDDYIACRI